MSDYERIVHILRQQNERITIQRRLVIEALVDTQAHMTINDVNEHIRLRQNEHNLSETTIYRILQWLKGLELVSQTDMAESGIVYQIIGLEKHHHLVCLNCNKTTDIDDSLFDAMREELLRQYDFHARIDHMAIYGYCANCLPIMEDESED
ncbi:MAG: Fur family transcriptional regulator [Phototrophicaceae bacterium]